MVEQAKFFNVKINVDGKIHNVKVEQGVTFNSCFALGDNKIVKYNHQGYDDWDDNNQLDSFGERIRPEYSNEIKMSKDEFTVFKNFANNKKENGNEIILSKEDISKAEELYRDGKFTKDISENLGGTVNKECQDLDTDFEAGRISITAKVDDTYMRYSNKDIYSDKIRALAEKSINGEIKSMFHGDDGLCGYKYTDKDGVLHYVYTHGGDARELTGDETKIYDKDGKHYEEYCESGKIVTKKVNYTEDNAEIEKFYQKGVLQYTSKTYRQGSKTINETEGNGYVKTVTYTNEKGQKVEEEYSRRSIQRRNINNGEIVELYNNGKLSTKQVRGTKYYYKDGKLDSSEQSIRVKDNTYVNCNFDKQNKLAACSGVNVKGLAEPKLSSKAQEYYNEFKTMSAQEIAKKIKGQIDGPSLNSKTLAMLEGVPADKFVDVLKEYKKIGGIWFGNKASLFTDIQGEWNVETKSLYNIARKAVASYIRTKTPKTLTPDDMAFIEKVKTEWGEYSYDGERLRADLATSEQRKKYFAEIEDYITK